ncbi:hypothetical protein [Caenispirillum salinarum]|uniref:hypothetical protein n=1 Tax=Caenispirillum salinarum TaxID=859058 RepID=UPI00384C228B
MTDRPDDPVDARRRRFLRGAGLSAAGAAAAVPVVLSGGDDAEAFSAPEEQVKGRYRLNDHVKRFYFLNRL